MALWRETACLNASFQNLAQPHKEVESVLLDYGGQYARSDTRYLVSYKVRLLMHPNGYTSFSELSHHTMRKIKQPRNDLWRELSSSLSPAGPGTAQYVGWAG